MHAQFNTQNFLFKSVYDIDIDIITQSLSTEWFVFRTVGTLPN